MRYVIYAIGDNDYIARADTEDVDSNYAYAVGNINVHSPESGIIPGTCQDHIVHLSNLCVTAWQDGLMEVEG